MNRPHLPLAALCGALLFAPADAPAAESYDNCAGTVPSLPAVLDKQGVWCLTKDLATLLASGNAITVTKPNVTLDCNGFKLGGLAAGLATQAVGVNASGQSNFTVRGCNIRGFRIGLLVDDTSGGGHVVEDNRFDGNTVFAISVYGDGSLIRRNQVLDTGGSTGAATLEIAGIFAEGNIDVLDNMIRVVDSTSQAGATAHGILIKYAQAGAITGNRISGLASGAADIGIRTYVSSGIAVRGNDVSSDGGGFGILCSSYNSGSTAVDNIVHDFTSPLGNCFDGGGNAISP